MLLDLSSLHDRILSGDEEAEVELYQWLHAHRLFFAGRRLYMAEDIATYVWLRLVRHIRAGKVKYPTALFAIADLIAFRYRGDLADKDRYFGEIRVAGSKGDRERGVDMLECVADNSPLITEHMRLEEMQRQLGEAIANLTQERAELVRRFYFEEQTQEQIMSELHITATQFRLHKSRALESIRKHLKIKHKTRPYHKKEQQ